MAETLGAEGVNGRVSAASHYGRAYGVGLEYSIATRWMLDLECRYVMLPQRMQAVMAYSSSGPTSAAARPGGAGGEWLVGLKERF